MRCIKTGLPVLALLLSAFCRAGTYSSPSYFNQYHGYYSPPWSRHEEPIISLELDPQASLNSSFRIAAREGRILDLERFAEQGANVNSASDTGETALMYASRNCSARVVSSLVKLKADINAHDREGRTALMYAASSACLPVVKLLLSEPGVDPRSRDKEGRSALDYAQDIASADVDGPAIDSIQALKGALRRHAHRVAAAGLAPRRETRSE